MKLLLALSVIAIAFPSLAQAAGFNQTIANGARAVAKSYGGLAGPLSASYDESGTITEIDFDTLTSWHCRVQRLGGEVFCDNSQTGAHDNNYIWTWIGN